MNAQTATAMATDASAEFRLAMRRVVAGVSVITSRDGDQPVGLLVTSLASVSAEPPTLAISINCQSVSHDPIKRFGAFCVNVLAADQQVIAKQFSDPSRRAERFQTGEWTGMQTGCPVLAGTAATFDCEVVHHLPYHSHTIFLGLVKASWTAASGATAPLVHYSRQYGPLAGFDVS